MAMQDSKIPPESVSRSDRFATLYDMPAHLVRRMLQMIHAMFQEESASFGITHAQFAVLTVVELGPGLEQREIAIAVGYDAATTGGILQRLEQLSLVRREKGTRSRRGRVVHLTEKGRRKLAQMMPGINRIQVRLLSGLDPSERKDLMYLLSKVTGVTNSFHPRPRS